MSTATKPTVFISYSHKDEDWKDRLMSHLAVLSDQGLLDLWEDRKIGAGDEWYEEIQKAMRVASVAVLLVSANSLTSKFILREEVSKLLKRCDKEGLIIFPVIVRSCPWKEVTWLAGLQVRPKDGKALASYGGNRRDEALSDIATEIYKHFKPTPGSSEERKIAAPDRTIEVVRGDVLTYKCDALVLKYAQGWYGADRLVADRLKIGAQSPAEITPSPGKAVVLPGRGQVAAQNVVFLGVPLLHEFDYEQIREFAIRAIKTLATELPGIRHVAMTMHGVGYGLDERESFLAQINGLAQTLQTSDVPQFLERVIIVEHDANRADRLKALLNEHLKKKKLPIGSRAKKFVLSTPVKEAGVKSSDKPYVFVAINGSNDNEDVYAFGIQAPANRAGYLCEKLDMTALGSEALARVKAKIDNAAVVIAHLSGSHTGGYFEVGYASAKSKPTLLLAKKADSLNGVFANERIIIYKTISELAKNVEKELTTIGKTH